MCLNDRSTGFWSLLRTWILSRLGESAAAFLSLREMSQELLLPTIVSYSFAVAACEKVRAFWLSERELPELASEWAESLEPFTEIVVKLLTGRAGPSHLKSLEVAAEGRHTFSSLTSIVIRQSDATLAQTHCHQGQRCLKSCPMTMLVKEQCFCRPSVLLTPE